VVEFAREDFIFKDIGSVGTLLQKLQRKIKDRSSKYTYSCDILFSLEYFSPDEVVH
jgi:hypothetical protein